MSFDKFVRNDSRVLFSVGELDSENHPRPVEIGSLRSTPSSTSLNAENPLKSGAWMNKVIEKQKKNVGVRSTFQGRVYNFLERPNTLWSMLYHCTSFLLLFACLVCSVLSTIRGYVDIASVVLFWTEIGLVLFFGSEFLVRVWSAGCQGKFIGIWGRLRYMKNPTCIIDAIVITASTYVLIHSSKGKEYATTAVSGIRFLQILRLIRIDRKGKTWRLLGSVVYSHRKELITTMYIAFLGLIFSTYFLFLAEQNFENTSGSVDFESYADAIWCGIVTYMTIGYGDKVPRTWMGKVITSICSLIIVSFISLPSGIVGSGLALKVQQKQRNKQFSKQFPAAAQLIQCAWRCYTIEKKNPSEVTWRVYVRPRKSNIIETRSAILLRRKLRSEASTPVFTKTLIKSASAYDNNAMDNLSSKGSYCSVSTLAMSPLPPEGGSVFEDARLTFTLSQSEKTAARAIRFMKFLVAKKNFLKSKKPYDVQDVIDQYSQGQTNMMFSLRELQRKLEQTIGKPPADDSPSLTNRLRRIEEKFYHIDRKIDALMEMMISNRIN